MIARRIGAWLAAGIAGSIVFWLVQVLTGGPAFMGDQIVSIGGYPKGLSTLAGWAVHIAVSLSYAFLFGVIAAVLSRAPFAVSAAVTLVAALVLGWVTAVIAPPAISVTISLLGGQGWPAELFPPELRAEPAALEPPPVFPAELDASRARPAAPAWR